MEVFAWIMMGLIVLTLIEMALAEGLKKHLLATNLTKCLIVEIIIFFITAIICGIMKVTLA